MPHPILRTAAILFAGLVICGPPAVGQIASYGVERHLTSMARQAAMSDEGTAEPNDATAMYWNPAALTFLTDSWIVTTYSVEEIKPDRLGTIQACGSTRLGNRFSIGLGGLYHWAFNPSLATPEARSSMTVTGVDGAISFRIRRDLSIGGQIRARQYTTSFDNDWAFFGSVGLFYFPVEAVTYGVTLGGLGNGIRHPYDVDPTETELEKYSIGGSINAGLSIRVPLKQTKKSFIMTLGVTRIFKEPEETYKIGLEWRPIDIAALRFGYWIGPNSEAAKFGGAVTFDPIEIGIATSLTSQEPRHATVSVGYRI